MKFTTVRTTVLAVALAASVPAMVSGQAVRDQPRATENRADNDVDFGWIGLLGLIGLFGLKGATASIT
jgi:hypothetical protein